jgi:GT2 family glycosyltransferase
MLPRMTPDLSIVIVSWNTRDLLAACLASLPDAVGGLTTEVLVADNASSDRTPVLLAEHHPAVRVLETGGNLGFTRANNLALAEAGGRRVLLLNPDTVCPPGSLHDLVARLDALPDAAAVGPAMVDGDGAPTACWGDFPRPWHHWRALVDPTGCWLPRRWRESGLGRTAASLRHHRGHRDPATGAVAVDYVKGACLLMTRDALDEVGPLDDRFFMYFEETDWCRRARATGRRIYCCPDVEIVHLEGRATGLVSRFSLQQFHHSYRLYLEKHETPATAAATRRAVRAEYTWKAWLRSLRRDPRSRALATQYRQAAALQSTPTSSAPTPPTTT